MAYDELIPSFISLNEKKQKQDKHNRIPHSINKDKLEGETRIKPVSAWSNSVFSVKLYSWNKEFAAENAL